MRFSGLTARWRRSTPAASPYSPGVGSFGAASPVPPVATLALLAAIGLFAIARLAGDYGISWDESVQARYGELVIDYFVSGGQDKSANTFSNLNIYGPLVDLCAASVYGWMPEYKYLIRHMTSALVGLLTIGALFRAGRLMGDPWIGVVASVALVLMPRFFGHAFVNSKDIPFACFFAWTLVEMAALVGRRTYRWRESLACGLAMGLTVSVRPGGWVLLTLIFVAMFVFADVARWMAARRAGAVAAEPSEVHGGRRPVSRLVAVFLVAWIVMVVPWPWAHENPLVHPIRAMQLASNFYSVVPVLFEGVTYPSDDLPWYYLPKYLLMTLPPAVLVLSGLGLVVAGAQLWRDPASVRGSILAALGLWLALPLVLCALKRPNIYDGMRHFLFLLPAVALGYGIAVCGVVRLAPARFRACLALLAAAVTLAPLADLVRLHPYQMTYFNPFVGGLTGAGGNYDTDYWVTSYAEAMRWIERDARPHPLRTVRVLVAANDHSRACAEHFCGRGMSVELVERFGISGPIPAPYDYYVGTYRMGMAGNYPDSAVVASVGRDGAVFTVVRRRTGRPGARAGPSAAAAGRTGARGATRCNCQNRCRPQSTWGFLGRWPPVSAHDRRCAPSLVWRIVRAYSKDPL